ncbi:hypothetical protein Rhal01_01526 [Rubritalea halochordaticola]|uniref:DinB-like domain-containing protein n=2 Tax=Rubritalea halochordaticola TaxID=714537 RepID=A0ABP9V2M5_9BACT
MIRFLVRARMKLTSRAVATEKIRDELRRYLGLMHYVPREKWGEHVRVPAMMGVDPDMREWSLLDICEHNAIVNRSIREVVTSLVTQEPMKHVIDPKRDVMPKGELGQKALDEFKQSVEDYLKALESYKGLRSTEQKKHPVFGMLNAHSWHVMFGLHLQIHRKQAEVVADLLSRDA